MWSTRWHDARAVTLNWCKSRHPGSCQCDGFRTCAAPSLPTFVPLTTLLDVASRLSAPLAAATLCATCALPRSTPATRAGRPCAAGSSSSTAEHLEPANLCRLRSPSTVHARLIATQASRCSAPATPRSAVIYPRVALRATSYCGHGCRRSSPPALNRLTRTPGSYCPILKF
jgi:hypothetical protein